MRATDRALPAWATSPDPECCRRAKKRFFQPFCQEPSVRNRSVETLSDSGSILAGATS